MHVKCLLRAMPNEFAKYGVPTNAHPNMNPIRKFVPHLTFPLFPLRTSSGVSPLPFHAVLHDPRMLLNLVQRQPFFGIEDQ